MTEKLSNLLFQPKTLIQYRSTNIFKVLLFLLVLSVFSLLVPMLDLLISPELTLNDKPRLEQVLSIDFSVAKDLPDCSLHNGTFSCADEASNEQEIFTMLNMIRVVSDENNNLTSRGTYLLKFTKIRLYYVDRLGLQFPINYQDLPSKWQEFDLAAIKNSPYPGDGLYNLFIGGLNQLIVKYLPIILVINIFTTFLMKLFETLFFSVFFYLLYRRYEFKFRELFKLAVFAQTLPIIITVILTALNFTLFNTLLVTVITFVYVHHAVTHNIPTNLEF